MSSQGVILSTCDVLSGGRRGRGEAGLPAPPCLPCPPSLSISNNCTKEGGVGVNKLTGGHKRIAQVIRLEIEALAREFSIRRLGFLTLTFPDHVTDMKVAQKRFHSLATHVIRKRYERALCVVERSKNGRIHFHLVIVLAQDIRTGFDFADVARGRYTSASSYLRSEWQFWREIAPSYRFGRTELLPVKSTAEGISKYVGKYVSKHIGQRLGSDKGSRLVRFIGYKAGQRKASTRFAYNTDNAWLWRAKLQAFAKGLGFTSFVDFKLRFGPRWAYYLQRHIIATDLGREVAYPSVRMALEQAHKASVSEALLLLRTLPVANGVAGFAHNALLDKRSTD